MTSRLVRVRPMSEDALQTHVLNAMQQLGWRRVHFRPAQTTKGWRTPVQGDGKGFPDIIALRGDRGLAIELKSDKGEVEPEQWAWLDAFAAAGFTARLWRPSDWYNDAILRELR